MLKDSYEFSPTGLDALRSDLATLRQNIERSAKQVLDAQVSDFTAELHRRSPADLTYTVDVSLTTGRATVAQVGDQVLFAEFGTGWLGASSNRHPQEGQLLAPDGEPYEVNKTQQDSTGWYFLDDNDVAQWTTGEPAGMQNYHAYQYVLNNKAKYASMLKGGK